MGRFKQIFYELNYIYPRWVTINNKHIYLKNQYSFDYDKLINKKTEKQEIKMTSEEKNEIEYYSDEGYKNINSFLRNKKKFIKKNYQYTSEEIQEIEEKIKIIDEFINKNPLKKNIELYQNIKLYRRTNNHEILNAIKNKKLKPGYEFIEKAYSSSSKSEKQSLKVSHDDNVFMIFVINAKKGQKAVDISDISKYGKEESEFLIARNTTFKISKIEKKNKKFRIPITYSNNFLEKEKEFTYIYMDIINQE